MPPVIKQTSTGTANGRARPGSVLSRAVPVSAAQDSAIHMLLYGRNRVGKTTLACQFPKPLLLVAVEPTKTGGARSVSKVAGVKLLRLKASVDLLMLADELALDDQYKTVVIDSATSLEEMILAEIMGWDRPSDLLAVGYTKPGDKVSTDQYTERAEKTRKVLRKFLDLPCHLVITANEKDHNPPEGRKSALAKGHHAESFVSAAMGGGNARWLADGCDYCCQLFTAKETREVRTKVQVGKTETEEVELVETGRVIRRLRTQYDTNYAGGFRSCTPDKVPEFVDNPTFDKIFKIIRGE